MVITSRSSEPLGDLTGSRSGGGIDPAGLRSALEQVGGVRRAFVDGPPWRVFLICDGSAGNASALELAARAVLARSGMMTDDVDVQVSFVSMVPKRHRVRFDAASFQRLDSTRAIAETTLEWNGETIGETIRGDAGGMAELRLPALATLRALERVVGDALKFHLIGIKTVRVFDGDMVVVLLGTEQATRRQLIGSALISEDVARTAAVAVLNATNRVLGNYLFVKEFG